MLYVLNFYKIEFSCLQKNEVFHEFYRKMAEQVGTFPLAQLEPHERMVVYRKYFDFLSNSVPGRQLWAYHSALNNYLSGRYLPRLQDTPGYDVLKKTIIALDKKDKQTVRRNQSEMISVIL